MPLEFRCVQCQKLLRVGDDAAGRQARCPQCGTIQEAPGSATTHSPPSAAPWIPPPSHAPANPFADQGSSMSPFSHAGQNPYLAPQAAAGPAAATRDMILAKVQTPATILLVMAVASAVLQCVAAAMTAFAFAVDNNDVPELIFNSVAIVFGLGASIVTILGAVKMRQLENYGLAMTAAILSVVPCTSACCIVTIPVGIWALAILCDSQVKQAFR